jgi:phosphoribosyl 1,2-cyclic phosphodiesterase
MKIKCYGSRGSIPVSGKEYIKFGGDTTCITVTSKDNDLIVIDAGTGIRKLGNDLLKNDTKKFSIIFTHSHWDHLMGFPFFKPLYSNEYEIDVYGCPFTSGDSIRDMLAGTMNPPYFPVDLGAIHARINYINVRYSSFKIGSLQIIPIQLSHPNQGIGYKVIEGDKSFVFLTDNELGYFHYPGLQYQDYVRDCKDADILFHDGEYTPEEYPQKKTWGHSSYEDAVNLALEAQVKKLGIFHHNQDRSDDEVDNIIENCKHLIQHKGSSLECFGVAAGDEFTL